MAKKINIKIFGLSIFIALQAAFCVYFRWIPFDILSKTVWAILILLIFVFTLIIYRVMSRFVLPYYQSHPKWINIGSLILGLIFPLLLMILIEYPIPDRSILILPLAKKKSFLHL